jgi:shikimate kinase
VTGSSRGHVDRPVALVGFMAAGKSTIGRLLAERLGLAFVDTDDEIEAALSKTVAQIFSEDGEAQFRLAERVTIARLLENGLQVLALGGGAFVDPFTRERLNARARTVWLDPPFEVISARLARSGERPLAATKSDDELQSLWQQRCPSYAEAHIRIDAFDHDPAAIVDEIIAELARA